MRWWLRKQFLRLKLYASENYYNEAESLIVWYAVCFALGAAFLFCTAAGTTGMGGCRFSGADTAVVVLNTHRAGEIQALDIHLAVCSGLERNQSRQYVSRCTS